jgi:hypothetical protein
LIVFAIDPGEHAGWAVAHNTIVLKAGAGDPPHLTCHVDAIVIERPVVYPGGEARANDQITLALNAGRWIERYANNGPVYCVPARNWKGSINKKAHHAQIRKTLQGAELTLWDSLSTHDARDAFALVLWAAKSLHSAPTALLMHRIKTET